MLSLRDENFRLLSNEAEDRGISVQELIRAVIIPDWARQSTFTRNQAVSSFSTSRTGIQSNSNHRPQLVPALSIARKSGGLTQ
ncbi:hypothetical protein E6H29_03395 [Candidatus Bathyarchaeota archaeon]|nr:MAG: hypothetical protein E6H29_03395 [Candidatus Bathyarchaeota archaeon]